MKSIHMRAGTQRTIVDVVRRDSPDSEYVVTRNSNLTLVLLSSGVTNSHIQLAVRLVGIGATAQVIGIIVGNNSSNLHLHTMQYHQAPETTSNLLVKSVLSDTSFFSYEGSIVVERKAQKTDAYQRNENVLLSEDARATSKPQLEILANDVRCTHGATVGTLPADQLWYLTSRGIHKAAARKLLINGFLESALIKISDTKTRQYVRRYIWGVS